MARTAHPRRGEAQSISKRAAGGIGSVACHRSETKTTPKTLLSALSSMGRPKENL